jgi:hypothetical protein
MNRLKKVVYKHRIRVKEFLSDFDRLRSGAMHENFFITGLSMAGIDRKLSAQQIKTIVDAYRMQVAPSLSMIDWVRFVEDVETVFTLKVCIISFPDHSVLLWHNLWSSTSQHIAVVGAREVAIDKDPSRALRAP